MSAGPDAGWRVTASIVLHGSGHVTPQLRQISRQLQHSVHCSDIHLTCTLVDGQVGEGGVKGPVHHSARWHGGRRRSSRGREDRAGKEDKGEEREEEQRRGTGEDHGGHEEERMKGQRRRGGRRKRREELAAGLVKSRLQWGMAAGGGRGKRIQNQLQNIHVFKLSLAL